MEDVWEVLASSRRSNGGASYRSTLVFLGVLTLTSCFDQVLIPDVETDGRLTVTNDEVTLSERLRYVEVEIPIDPVSPGLFGAAAAAPAPSSVTLTLVRSPSPVSLVTDMV